MKTAKLLLLSVCLLISQILLAQHRTDAASVQQNLLKLNITSPILKNYSVQYERILSKRISIALSGRIMPMTTTPFKAMIKKRITDGGDNDLVNDILDGVKFSNYAITPELRFYVGKKGYGQGFYIAPYYRYANYTLHQSSVSIDDGGQNYQVQLSGNLTSHTGGLLFGSQWNLGKSIGLDLWVFGPNIGGGNGAITGVSNTKLTPDEQTDLKKRLEDVDIPYIKEKVTVNENGAKMDLNGLWAGVRAGLLFTFRF